MGDFVLDFINKKELNEHKIKKIYCSLYLFLNDLLNYYINNDIDFLSDENILYFNNCLEKFMDVLEGEECNNICDKIYEFYKKINDIPSSKKNNSSKLSDFLNDLNSFLEKHEYTSNKADLEQIEIGHKLDKLIFEEQSEIIFVMLNKSDRLCRYKYKDGQLLIDKVFLYFKKIVKDKGNYEASIKFYQSLIFHILCNDCYKKGNKIIEIINNLSDFKKTLNCSKQHKAVLMLIDNLKIISSSSITSKEKEGFINNLLKNYDIHVNFSSDIEKSVDLVSCRKPILDLRDEYIITMDSKFKSAYDDAISIEKTDNGYLLGIYITDVASFVGDNTLLYQHALQRGESIYTSLDNNNFYSPMFPIELTRDFFSLNMGSDRQVIAYLFEFSDDFDLIKYESENAIINVKKNYSFDNIDRMSPNDSNYDMVYLLMKLTDSLSKSFNKNYHLFKEKKSDSSRNSKYSLSVGSKIISTSTLFLNSFIASKFSKRGWPYIYRVNETELPINKCYFSDLDKLVGKYHGSKYSFKPLGHVGNNNKVYGHITNPIRSFASYLNQYFFEYLCLDWRSFEDVNKFLDYWNNELPSLVDNLNNRLDINSNFVSVMNELDGKRLTKKK